MQVLPETPLPLIVAPMAGGPSTPALVAAAHRAGARGFLAAGYLGPEAFARELDETHEAVGSPEFGVNIFLPEADPVIPEGPEYERYRAALNLFALNRDYPAPAEPAAFREDHYFPEKLALILRNPPETVSFTFGIPEAEVVAELHASGCSVGVTVTTAAEARAVPGGRADYLIVQGTEAGGHRGSHTQDGDAAGIPLRTLLAEVSAATSLPLIAAGGVSRAAEVRELLAAGAARVQVGTLLIAATESGASAAQKEALIAASAGESAITRAFSGRWARGIHNDLMREIDPVALPGFPTIHHLTAGLRAQAAAAGDASALALWAGTGLGGARRADAAEILAGLNPAG